MYFGMILIASHLSMMPLSEGDMLLNAAEGNRDRKDEALLVVV